MNDRICRKYEMIALIANNAAREINKVLGLEVLKTDLDWESAKETLKKMGVYPKEGTL
jgi:hypothetical protein